MSHDHKVASVAFLIADRARVAMLMFLLDGKARPAGELADVAGVTAQTASSHLSKLLAGELLAVETTGRHRHYRLANAHVAAALEKLAVVGTLQPSQQKRENRKIQELRFARCCYDHLAGRVGVVVTQAMQRQDLLVAASDKRFDVTAAGVDWFYRFGLDMGQWDLRKRDSAHQCLDSTEHQHHLAGALGKQFMSTLCSKGWLYRQERSRAVYVTPAGWGGLKKLLDVDAQSFLQAE